MAAALVNSQVFWGGTANPARGRNVTGTPGPGHAPHPEIGTNWTHHTWIAVSVTQRAKGRRPQIGGCDPSAYPSRKCSCAVKNYRTTKNYITSSLL